jgi:hypothetical protein
MALVLSLEAGDQFNVGHRRFKIVAVEVPSGVVINELGVGTFVVQATEGLKLSGEIAFQEGLRQQKAVTRLMISAPKSVKIWLANANSARPSHCWLLFQKNTSYLDKAVVRKTGASLSAAGISRSSGI